MAAMVEGPVTSMTTASALQLHPSAKVFVDESAASQLKMRDYYDWVQKKKPDAPKDVITRRGADIPVRLPPAWQARCLPHDYGPRRSTFISTSKGRGQTVVLPEGADARVITAARDWSTNRSPSRSFSESRRKSSAAAKQAGVSAKRLRIVNPAESESF